jgi:hypothetical protein
LKLIKKLIETTATMDGGSSILSAHGGPTRSGGGYNPSQSMLWGRSDMKEKFYSGSSQSNPWVRDLLWKAYIVKQKKDSNMNNSSPMDEVPPHMRSAHAAFLQAERKQKEQQRLQKIAEKKLEKQVAMAVAMENGPATARSRMISARLRPSSSYSSSSYGGDGGIGGNYKLRSSRRSNKKLPALNFEKLRGSSSTSRLPSRSSSRASSRASSRGGGGKSTNRSSYSRSSIRGGDPALSSLASILRAQNDQLRKGLQQQDERGKNLEEQLIKIHKRVEQLSRQRAREKRNADKKLLAYKTIVTKLSNGLSELPPSSSRRR